MRISLLLAILMFIVITHVIIHQAINTWSLVCVELTTAGIIIWSGIATCVIVACLSVCGELSGMAGMRLILILVVLTIVVFVLIALVMVALVLITLVALVLVALELVILILIVLVAVTIIVLLPRSVILIAAILVALELVILILIVLIAAI